MPCSTSSPPRSSGVPPPLPARPVTPCRPTGRRTARRRTPPRPGPSGHGHRIGLLLDQRHQVEHLEDPLEADQRAGDLDVGVGQRGQRRVQPGQQQRQRHDRAGLQVPTDRQHATQPVHQGQRQRRHQRQRVHERRTAASRYAPRCRAPDRPATANSRDSVAGLPNSLTSVAPGAEKRSVIWVFIVALWMAASRRQPRHGSPDPARGHQEQRHQQQRQQRDLPGDAEHHHERQRQGDDVGDDAGERVGERALRARSHRCRAG